MNCQKEEENNNKLDNSLPYKKVAFAFFFFLMSNCRKRGTHAQVYCVDAKQTTHHTIS
jgi:hypothetical protein